MIARTTILLFLVLLTSSLRAQIDPGLIGLWRSQATSRAPNGKIEIRADSIVWTRFFPYGNEVDKLSLADLTLSEDGKVVTFKSYFTYSRSSSGNHRRVTFDVVLRRVGDALKFNTGAVAPFRSPDEPQGSPGTISVPAREFYYANDKYLR